MATQLKLDATKPLYAWVGAADLAVEKLRGTAADVHEQVRNAERDPKAIAAQVRTQLSGAVNELVEGLQGELRGLPKSAQSRLQDVQSEAKSLLGKVETLVESRATALRADIARTLDERVEELATRGHAVVAKRRDNSISGDVEIIDPDAVVVKQVSPAVEKAAAEAASQASAQQPTA